MNELGNTPADKSYKPSRMSRAEEAALKAYPDSERDELGILTFWGYSQRHRNCFIKGYEQAERDILAIVKEYVEKGLRCMEQSDESQIHAFWDGFHNCAENILREMEDEK